MNPPQILIVEDDPGIASGLVRGLRAAGFAVELCTDGESGRVRLLQDRFDFVILDLMLPERSGFELLECWRERTRVPVLVLTARKDLASRVQSFKLGAVDWMSKPFFMEELLARIHTRLHPTSTDPTTVVGWGDVQLDLDRRLATRAGRRIELTGHEFNLLAMLVQRPGRVMSRRQLGRAALPADGDRCDRTINSHIARIRRKLGPAGRAIHTVRGAGYCFEFDESEP